MTSSLEDEIQRVLASMDNEQSNQEQEQPDTTEQEKEPAETIHIHYFPDAIVIVKEGEETPQPNHVVETTLAQTKKPPLFIAYAVGVFYLLLILSTLAFQVYEILNPPIATVTIIPKSQTVTLSGTLQLGRLLHPLTISQSQTAPTTGKGHQDAKAATGSITFYNGQSNQVTVPAGTTLTGSSGEQIVTDADANIPAEIGSIPPTLGQASVSAQAVTPGSRGNIPVGDINQPCCTTAIRAINTTSFSGGQDERNFQTVAKSDIENAAAPLQATVTQDITAALQGQVKQGEQLQTLPCTPSVISDHPIGTEAIQVKVTVSETCSGVVYNSQELTSKVTQLLTAQAAKKVETGYSLLGNPQITVTSATLSKQVTLSFTSVSTWIYALSSAEQNHIKKIIAGKTKEQAIELLSTLPGIENVSLQSSGFGDDTRIPKDISHIHLLVIYTAA